MDRIINCIFVEHDLSLVGLAALICLLCCHTTFRLIDRARRSEKASRLWVPLTALSLGGGVWATHFVAMLAYNTTIPFTFDVPLTVLSAVIAIIVGGIGIWVALDGPRVLGGLVVGLSVGAMHFTGMAAVEGPISVYWDDTLVTVAWSLGAVFAVSAFIVNFRESGRWNHVAAVVCLTLAICGLHFVGMSAMQLALNPFAGASGPVVLDSQSLAIAVAAFTMLVLGGGLMLAYLDSFVEGRNLREENRLREYVAELETTQTALEAKSAELTAALKRADALSEAKSEFMATMSHELRTPLNAIIGFSEFVQLEPRGPIGHPSYVDYMKDIVSSGRHLLKLINDVLDFSKIEAGQMQLSDDEIDLSEMIANSVRMVEQQAVEKGIVIATRLPDRDGWIRADNAKIRQILLNLLGNAIKFTEGTGDITVSLGYTENGPRISISDQGVGMTEEEITDAVEIFRQVDNSLSRRHEGAGLGLPLCIRLTEMHDGTMRIFSEKGRGTRVVVDLPEERMIPVPEYMQATG